MLGELEKPTGGMGRNTKQDSLSSAIIMSVSLPSLIRAAVLATIHRMQELTLVMPLCGCRIHFLLFPWLTLQPKFSFFPWPFVSFSPYSKSSVGELDWQTYIKSFLLGARGQESQFLELWLPDWITPLLPQWLMWKNKRSDVIQQIHDVYPFCVPFNITTSSFFLFPPSFYLMHTLQWWILCNFTFSHPNIS